MLYLPQIHPYHPSSLLKMSPMLTARVSLIKRMSWNNSQSWLTLLTSLANRSSGKYPSQTFSHATPMFKAIKMKIITEAKQIKMVSSWCLAMCKKIVIASLIIISNLSTMIQNRLSQCLCSVIVLQAALAYKMLMPEQRPQMIQVQLINEWIHLESKQPKSWIV